MRACAKTERMDEEPKHVNYAPTTDIVFPFWRWFWILFYPVQEKGVLLSD